MALRCGASCDAPFAGSRTRKTGMAIEIAMPVEA